MYTFGHRRLEQAKYETNMKQKAASSPNSNGKHLLDSCKDCLQRHSCYKIQGLPHLPARRGRRHQCCFLFPQHTTFLGSVGEAWRRRRPFKKSPHHAETLIPSRKKEFLSSSELANFTENSLSDAKCHSGRFFPSECPKRVSSKQLHIFGSRRRASKRDL